MSAYWQQSLKTTHAASIPIWAHSVVLGWVRWPQGPVTLLIALVVAWVGLRYRYWKKGRPFGSPEARRRAMTVMVMTALLGTVIGVLLPRLPVTIGAFVPALLCADRNRQIELNAVENPPWFGIITLGVSLLLDWLECQMATDRMNWCDRKMADIHGLDELARIADEVYDRLTMLNSSDRLKTRLKSDYGDIGPAVTGARQAQAGGPAEEYRRQCHVAETALRMMLGRAYDWGFTDIVVAPSRPDPRRELV